MGRNAFAPYGGNYPAMTQSQWENAPFNQVEPEEATFKKDLAVTLEKNVEFQSLDYEDDGDGELTYCGNIANDYKESTHTIPELLAELASRLEKEIEACKEQDTRDGKRKLSSLEKMLRDAKGWEIVNVEEI